MNQMRKNLLLIAALIGAAPTAYGASTAGTTNPNVVVPTFVPRSPSVNKYAIDAGMTQWNHQFGLCGGEVQIIPEYTRTFRPNNISSCLFGGFLVNTNNPTTTNLVTNSSSNNAQTLLIQGSQVTGRSANALVADNFYLPPSFSSQVSFSPRITNGMVNFDLYMSLDWVMSGLYARVYGPFVHTKWDLGFVEENIVTGTFSLPGGLIAETDIPAGSLLGSFEAYAQGTAPASTYGNNLFNGSLLSGGGTPAPFVNPGLATAMDGLRYARMTEGSNSLNGFADLWAEVGWDFLQCDDYHLGIFFQMAIPTGQKSNPCLLFSPRLGDDHWQLGGGVTAHYSFWNSDCDDFNIGFYLDAGVTHVFRRTERRVFDLVGAPLSRYMLAARFVTNAESLVAAATPATAPAPANVFAYEVGPVANLTQRDVKVSYGVQADVVAWLNMEYCNFSFDLGYNFWARSREHINPVTGCQPFQFNTLDNQWGLKGNAQVFGYVATIGTPVVTANAFAFPLSATQSQAQINCVLPNGAVAPAVANACIDAPGVASFLAQGVPLPLPGNLVASPVVGSVQTINTSTAPVLLTESSIDYSVRTRGLSHTVFTNLSYNFECDCWMPFVGIGGFAEFGNHSNPGTVLTCPTTCPTATTSTTAPGTTTVRCAVSQWGVWVKGGVAFN
jgi:hypothetical protein